MIDGVLQNVLVKLAGMDGHQFRARRFGRGEKHLVIGVTVGIPINRGGGVARAGMAVKSDDAVRFEVALDLGAKGIKI